MVDVSGHFRNHGAALSRWANPIRPARSARRHGWERRIKEGARIRDYPRTFSVTISFAASYGVVVVGTAGGRRGSVGMIDNREATIRPSTRHRMWSETSRSVDNQNESRNANKQRDVRRNQYLDTGEMMWGG